MHFLPSGHFGQVKPPQSTSVSIPFWMPSLHVGIAVQTPLSQLPLWQSRNEALDRRTPGGRRTAESPIPSDKRTQ